MIAIRRLSDGVIMPYNSGLNDFGMRGFELVISCPTCGKIVNEDNYKTCCMDNEEFRPQAVARRLLGAEGLEFEKESSVAKKIAEELEAQADR